MIALLPLLLTLLGPPVTRGYTIPIVDLSDETHRQTVVDREPALIVPAATPGSAPDTAGNTPLPSYGGADAPQPRIRRTEIAPPPTCNKH